jgi:ABC-2 type transport system ATP-binding protein
MARFDGEVPELEVRRPSLEDVYLDLIGKAGSAAAETTAVEAGVA